MTWLGVCVAAPASLADRERRTVCYFNMNPRTSHADIEQLHGLQRGTFKAYVRYSRQYEIDLKEAAEKAAKRPRVA